MSPEGKWIATPQSASTIIRIAIEQHEMHAVVESLFEASHLTLVGKLDGVFS